MTNRDGLKKFNKKYRRKDSVQLKLYRYLCGAYGLRSPGAGKAGGCMQT